MTDDRYGTGGGELQVYGIFSGGGLQAIPLTGALAATNHGLMKFRGYGGSSMGAIIALLSALQLGPDQVRQTLINIFLNNAELQAAFVNFEKLERHFNLEFGENEGGSYSLPEKMGLEHQWVVGRKVKKLWNKNSLHQAVSSSGTASSSVLRNAIAETLGREVSWTEFGGEKPLLKVVATDLAAQRAVVFPDDNPDIPVLDAVTASACYPFAFAPHVFDGRAYADGGISSNAPAFLFNTEAKFIYGRTILFSTVQPPKLQPRNLRQVLSATLSAALTAGDALLPNMLRRLIHIEVPADTSIPVIGTCLKLPGRMTSNREALINRIQDACVEAREFATVRLSNDPVLSEMYRFREWREQAAVEYKPFVEWDQIFNSIRNKVATRFIENLASANPSYADFVASGQLIRCCLLVPHHAANDVRWRIVHFTNFESAAVPPLHTDKNIELDTAAPGATEAAHRREPVLFDVLRMRSEFPDDENIALVPDDRRAGVAVPIFHDRAVWDIHPTDHRPDAIAILVVDTPFTEEDLFGDDLQLWTDFQSHLVAASMAASRLLGG